MRLGHPVDTYSCPFVLLAHYGELEWVSILYFSFLEFLLMSKAAQFGAEADLIRTSVGLGDAAALSARFQRALDAVSP